jgi:hypothetical protein
VDEGSDAEVDVEAGGDEDGDGGRSGYAGSEPDEEVEAATVLQHLTPLGHAFVASAPAGFWGVPPLRRLVHRHADPAAASPIGSTSRDGAASR